MRSLVWTHWGITFDKNINLEEHIRNKSKGAFYHLRNIAKIRNCLSQKDTEILVHAFISSKIDYCNALLYGLPQKSIEKLQHVQNCAARLTTRTKKCQHITPVLEELHWLPVMQRVKYKILLLTYKALNEMAPQYMTDLLEHYIPPRNLRSASKNLLKVPKSNLKSYGDRSFKVAAPKLWNNLTHELRNNISIDTFKKNLKTLLFKEAFT